MFTVMVCLELSGKTKNRNPFGKEYSVIPSTVVNLVAPTALDDTAGEALVTFEEIPFESEGAGLFVAASTIFLFFTLIPFDWEKQLKEISNNPIKITCFRIRFIKLKININD